MAHTELTLRLIKDDNIVGYSAMTDRGYKGLQCGYIKPANFPDFPIYGFRPIVHDSFELGIKVGDEWWFEGDVVKTDEGDWVGRIYYDDRHNCFGVEDDLGGFSVLCNWWNFKRIGNIHEDK
jgi:hypothetical protein